ncbi:MAG: DMT family transporter [Nitrosospira sp.]
MSSPMLMIAATLLFATMGMCVKFASADYSTAEMVFYRGVIGAAIMILLARARGQTLRTRLPAMHFRRSLAGVCALGLLFYAIGALPLSTAVTLNYMSPIWMTLLLLVRAAISGGRKVDSGLACTVLAGFVGVICILQPAIAEDQLGPGLMGLLSGLLTALAYLQVVALGRAGEPETRVVFYFSLCSICAGAAVVPLASGWHAHTLKGLGMLLAIGLLATFAQLLMTRAYATGRVLVNASLQYLNIGWSYIYGVVLFSDPVTGVALLGMGLIVGAGIKAARLRQSAGASRQIGKYDGR